MAGNIHIRVDGLETFRAVLIRLDPASNPDFVRRALIKGGTLIQREAQLNQIKKGGGRKRGPNDKPLPDRLTSRTGTGRRSIRVDRGGLPDFFVDIGSDLEYMKLHETGGTVGVRGHSRRSHFRRTATGTQFVIGHDVASHQATFPKRAYLAPALDEVNADLQGLFVNAWDSEVSGR